MAREHRLPVRVYFGDTALVSPGGRPRRLPPAWARIFTALIEEEPSAA